MAGRSRHCRADRLRDRPVAGLDETVMPMTDNLGGRAVIDRTIAFLLSCDRPARHHGDRYRHRHAAPLYRSIACYSGERPANPATDAGRMRVVHAHRARPRQGVSHRLSECQLTVGQAPPAPVKSIGMIWPPPAGDRLTWAGRATPPPSVCGGLSKPAVISGMSV
jgi:hypothetical protein